MGFPSLSNLLTMKCLVFRHRPDETPAGVRPAEQRGRSQCPEPLGTAMTQMNWKMRGTAPTSKDVRWIVSLLILSLLLLAPAAAPAADQPAGPFLFASSNRRENDLEIETKVRRALRNDAQLRPLNLNVHVAGGTAQLSGPVPSQQLKQRAIALVAHVEGVLKVTAQDLYLSSAAEGSKQMSVLVTDDQPIQTRSASPHSLSHGTVPLAQTDTSSDVRPDRTEPVSSSGQRVTLLAPEPAPRPRRVPDPARLTANPRPVSTTVSMTAALEQLRQRDSRFQQIRTQIQGATVNIFSGETPVEDAMMFAQAVRRLPGVQHVVVAPGSR